MAFYENTIVAKQDLAANDLEKIRDKYLVSVQEPRQLSKTTEGNFDASFVISKHNCSFELLFGPEKWAVCAMASRELRTPSGTQFLARRPRRVNDFFIFWMWKLNFN